KGDAGPDITLVGRARERREPPFDAAVVEEVSEFFAHFASFRQAEGCCSETRGDTPAYRPATEKALATGLFLFQAPIVAPLSSSKKCSFRRSPASSITSSGRRLADASSRAMSVA